MMIERSTIIEAIKTALKRSRVTILVGPRQCGKTTLAREFLDPESVNYFDLEDPLSLARLDEPMTALEPLQGLVVIDEIQRRPDLFPVLRVLTDRKNNPAQFLILGSASGELLRQTSESLAGRIEKISISGFSLPEVGVSAEFKLWLRGGYPLSYLADNDIDSLVWRKNFIQTLLERDFPQWGVKVSSRALMRFWAILAHYHGQTWNAAEPARALGVGETTMRRHLDLMTDALMIRQIQPYYANIGKRQVKSPKVYVRDSGILHQLLGVNTAKTLLTHPKIGASWEGFVIEQILALEPHDEAFFWATHQGAEMDLILRRDTQLFGIECKRADSPRMTPSVRHAFADLGLAKVAIIYPGKKRISIGDNTEAVPFGSLGLGEPVFPE
jgi:predicted AAA+ superfamily ATPase